MKTTINLLRNGFNFISFALYGGKNLGVSNCNAI